MVVSFKIDEEEMEFSDVDELEESEEDDSDAEVGLTDEFFYLTCICLMITLINSKLSYP